MIVQTLAGKTALITGGGEGIGGAIATRAIMADLRAGMDGPLGASGGGPPPFARADRSRFLQALDRELVALSK